MDTLSNKTTGGEYSFIIKALEILIEKTIFFVAGVIDRESVLVLESICYRVLDFS